QLNNQPPSRSNPARRAISHDGRRRRPGLTRGPARAPKQSTTRSDPAPPRRALLVRSVCSNPSCSKQELERELKLPRIICRSVLSKRRRKGCSAGNVGKICVIEDIEDFGPELQCGVFSNGRVLDQRKIHSALARSGNDIPCRVAEGELRRHLK